MSISGISSRPSIPYTPATSLVQNAPVSASSRTSELGSSSGSTGLKLEDIFDSGSSSGRSNNSLKKVLGAMLEKSLEAAGLDSGTVQALMKQLNGGQDRGATSPSGSEETSAVGRATPGGRAFGEALQNAMKSAGVDEATIRSTLEQLNGGKSRGDTSGMQQEKGAAPGSAELADTLHRAMKSAGMDDAAIKSTLDSLNGGANGASDSRGMTDLAGLLSKLDDSSLGSINDNQDVLDQLVKNPELVSQLAQNPELLQLMINQAR